MRTKRSMTVSVDPFTREATPAGSLPIVAVLAKEQVFVQIAHDAHARFLAEGSPENAEDVSLHQWLARAGLVL